MAFPQINAAMCAVIVTVALWTRLKLPQGCHFQEASLRRQNVCAYWAFAILIGIELVAELLPVAWLHWLVGPLSGLIFYGFAVTAYRHEVGFWSKRRNQLLGMTVTALLSISISTFLEYASLNPLLSALAISHLCHKRYMQTMFESMKDIETLQAKLLRQEAAYSNLRHFDAMQLGQTSQQA
ncbi:MAG: hypothetical protein NTX25_14585 [Proteobacteria bacterium]|nr:hypothetical protein [Pseudomonadota bacterium]